MNTSVKEWYMKTYPTDELGKDINDVTFYDVFDCLDFRQDFYELIGGECDSIIRERIFEKLASLIDTDYDYIYDQWLLGAK